MRNNNENINNAVAVNAINSIANKTHTDAVVDRIISRVNVPNFEVLDRLVALHEYEERCSEISPFRDLFSPGAKRGERFQYIRFASECAELRECVKTSEYLHNEYCPRSNAWSAICLVEYTDTETGECINNRCFRSNGKTFMRGSRGTNFADYVIEERERDRYNEVVSDVFLMQSDIDALWTEGSDAAVHTAIHTFAVEDAKKAQSELPRLHDENVITFEDAWVSGELSRSLPGEDGSDERHQAIADKINENFAYQIEDAEEDGPCKIYSAVSMKLMRELIERFI
jgi:hypothetical protein